MAEKKGLSFLTIISTVICVVFVCEAAAPAAAIGNQQFCIPSRATCNYPTVFRFQSPQSRCGGMPYHADCKEVTPVAETPV